jgi:hypothetical protein
MTTISARIPADLILAVRKAEGWPRIEGDTLATIRKMNSLYNIIVTRDGRYVATRKKDRAIK